MPDGTIDSSDMCSQAVVERVLGDDSVTSVKIFANLESDTYDGGVISVDPGTDGWRIERNTGDAVFNDAVIRGTLNADDITAGTLDTARITAGSLDGDKITAGTLDADRITANTITAGEIASGAIATDELDANAVTADKIAAGTITTDEIDADTITVSNLLLKSGDNMVENPGFETLNLDGWDAVSGSWEFTDIARSGGGAALIVPSGNQTLESGKYHATEGEEYYAEAFVRLRDPGAGTPGHRGRIIIRFEDTDGLQTTSVASRPSSAATSYTKVSVSATAPADTVKVMVRIQGREAAGGDYQVLFDDVVLRRKTITLMIEDQAVDIERMLDPVYTDTLYKINWSSALTTSITTVSEDFTIPAWVGEVSIMATSHTCVFYSSASTILFHWTGIGGTDGPHVQGDIISGENSVHTNSFTRTITSPGSTVTVEQDVRVSTGTESGSYVWINAIAVGVR